MTKKRLGKPSQTKKTKKQDQKKTHYVIAKPYMSDAAIIKEAIVGTTLRFDECFKLNDGVMFAVCKEKNYIKEEILIPMTVMHAKTVQEYLDTKVFKLLKNPADYMIAVIAAKLAVSPGSIKMKLSDKRLFNAMTSPSASSYKVTLTCTKHTVNRHKMTANLYKLFKGQTSFRCKVCDRVAKMKHVYEGDPCLYYVLLFEATDPLDPTTFIKVGVTKSSIDERYKGGFAWFMQAPEGYDKTPYRIKEKIALYHFEDGLECYDFEQAILVGNLENKFDVPKIFDGKSECFSVDDYSNFVEPELIRYADKEVETSFVLPKRSK